MAKNLTKEQAIAEHRKMWNWIADETEKSKKIVGKSAYFRKTAPNDMGILHDCYCCRYDISNIPDRTFRCRYCPIDWGNNTRHQFMCQGFNGLYTKWCTSTDWEKSAKLARQIANLPERM